VINEGVFAYLQTKLAEFIEHYPDLIIIETNHDRDHIHFLISIPPTTSVGKVIGLIKQNTSKSLKQKFPHIQETYWGTNQFWSEGYFVSTVGANQTIIQKYIQHQGKEDQGQTLFEL
jgi:putative transposase